MVVCYGSHRKLIQLLRPHQTVWQIRYLKVTELLWFPLKEKVWNRWLCNCCYKGEWKDTGGWQLGAWSSSSGFSCLTLGKSQLLWPLVAPLVNLRVGMISMVSIVQNWLTNWITWKAHFKLQTPSPHHTTPVQPADSESLSSDQDQPSLGITGLDDS